MLMCCKVDLAHGAVPHASLDEVDVEGQLLDDGVDLVIAAPLQVRAVGLLGLFQIPLLSAKETSQLVGPLSLAIST